MINKKNVLGKTPAELGLKDAIHVAIVSVRAAEYIEPGTRCSLNEHREAVVDHKGVMISDPFYKKSVKTGDPVWMLLAQDEVPNVQHHWEHPTIDFTPPTREPEFNYTLKTYADELGVTYHQLMEAMESFIQNERFVKYPGSKTEEELEEIYENQDNWELWSEWSDVTGYEFENQGTACCPEYDYPRGCIFRVR